MKKVLFALLALVLVCALAACGQDAAPAEEEGAGNTDEGMVALVLEQYFKDAYPDMIEEFVPGEIKVYTADEIAANDVFKDYDIAEGVEDLNQFTAATGEIDGQWVRNKFNLGIARDNGDGTYTIDAFGTGW